MWPIIASPDFKPKRRNATPRPANDSSLTFLRHIQLGLKWSIIKAKYSFLVLNQIVSINIDLVFNNTKAIIYFLYNILYNI